MTRLLSRAGLLLPALALALGSLPAGGCGPATPDAGASGTAQANPTRRLMAKDANSEIYKKMVGKDGKLLWKPGMPKKAPGGSR